VYISHLRKEDNMMLKPKADGVIGLKDWMSKELPPNRRRSYSMPVAGSALTKTCGRNSGLRLLS